MRRQALATRDRLFTGDPGAVRPLPSITTLILTLVLQPLSDCQIAAEESRGPSAASTPVPVSAAQKPCTAVLSSNHVPGINCPANAGCKQTHDVCQIKLEIQQRFPGASVEVYRGSKGILLLDGSVKKPDDVPNIVRLAETYSPKVINRLEVAGVAMIVLPATVLEVPTIQLEQVSAAFCAGGAHRTDAHADELPRETMDFELFDAKGDELVEQIKSIDGARVLAEPTLVTASGRPASFNAGGEFPVPTAQSNNSVSIEYKKHGTQFDGVPIMLGNGNIRLEVRLRVSELDPARVVEVDGISVPGLRVRELDTGVEMKPGQTLFLRGLVQRPSSPDQAKAGSKSLVLVLQPRIHETVANAPSPTKLQ